MGCPRRKKILGFFSRPHKWSIKYITAQRPYQDTYEIVWICGFCSNTMKECNINKNNLAKQKILLDISETT
jgi:hypothetical protein